MCGGFGVSGGGCCGCCNFIVVLICCEIFWICKFWNRVKLLFMVYFGWYVCDCSVVFLGIGVVCNKCLVIFVCLRGEGFGVVFYYVIELNWW